MVLISLATSANQKRMKEKEMTFPSATQSDWIFCQRKVFPTLLLNEVDVISEILGRGDSEL